MMPRAQSIPQQDQSAEQQKQVEEERLKLVVHKVKLPNGATFTRLKSVTQS